MKSRIYCFLELSAKSISAAVDTRPNECGDFSWSCEERRRIPRDKPSKNFNENKTTRTRLIAIVIIVIFPLFHSFIFLFVSCSCVLRETTPKNERNKIYKKVADDLCNFSFLTVTTFCIKRENFIFVRCLHLFCCCFCCARTCSLTHPSSSFDSHSINDCHFHLWNVCSKRCCKHETVSAQTLSHSH